MRLLGDRTNSGILAAAAAGAVLLVGCSSDRGVATSAATRDPAVLATSPIDGSEGEETASEPSVAPFEPASPDPTPRTVFAETDWSGSRWDASECYDSYAEVANPVVLSDVGGGILRYNPNGLGATGDESLPVFEVDLSTATFGDLTGDGHDDIALTSWCEHYGASFGLLHVWTHGQSGESQQLPAVLGFSWAGDHLAGFEIADGHLRTTTLEWSDSSSGTPDVEVVTDWSWDGGRWQATEVPQPDAESDQAVTLSDGRFLSPSGNIQCMASDSNLDCQISSGLNPPPPGGCPGGAGDWAGVLLPPAGRGEPYCVSDSWLEMFNDAPVLAYGETWTYGPYACESAESGVTCRNRSDNWFHLRRASWTIG